MRVWKNTWESTVFCALLKACPGSAVSWNRQNCNRQNMHNCKTLVHLGLVCVQMLGHKCSFPNSHFLVLRNNKRSSGIDGKTSDCLSRSCLYYRCFELVTFIWIVWTCDCFLVDFLMIRALLVKNYQIKLLKKVWYIPLVLCTCYKSFSIQHGAHQDNWKY